MSKKIWMILVVNLILLIGVIFVLVNSGDNADQEVDTLEIIQKDEIVTSWKKVKTITIQSQSARCVEFFADFVYIGDDKGVSRCTYDGKTTIFQKLPGDVTAMTSGKWGVYAATPRQIVFLDGKIYNEWAKLDSRTRITGLAVSGDKLFVADAGNRKVYCFDLNGKKLWETAGADGEKFIVPSPYFDLVPDGDGGVWVVNPGRHRVENYTAEGKFKALWKPLKQKTFSGCCNPAYLGILSGDRFVTLEKGLVRSRLFSPSGKVIEYVVSEKGFSQGAFRYDLAVLPDGKVAILDGAAGKINIYDRGKNE
jgi:outer membrane protein assembly factor BamB